MPIILSTNTVEDYHKPATSQEQIKILAGTTPLHHLCKNPSSVAAANVQTAFTCLKTTKTATQGEQTATKTS